MDKKTIISTPEKALLPWGMRVVFTALSFKPLPIGNRNEIVHIKKLGGGQRPIIKKDQEAERYIRRLRAAFMAADLALRKQDATWSEISKPIGGSICPLRVDVFYQWDKGDNRHGEMRLSDLDNLTKGVFDALKLGEVQGPVTWGLVDDDRHIVESFQCKGHAPADGNGSRITVSISRAGFRAPEWIHKAIQVIGPFPPWIMEAQEPVKARMIAEEQKRIMVPRLLGPDGGQLKKH